MTPVETDPLMGTERHPGAFCFCALVLQLLSIIEQGMNSVKGFPLTSHNQEGIVHGSSTP